MVAYQLLILILWTAIIYCSFRIRNLSNDNFKLKQKFKLLSRYHGGDGSVTRLDVMRVLGNEEV